MRVGVARGANSRVFKYYQPLHLTERVEIGRFGEEGEKKSV